MKTFGGKVLFLDRSDINTDEIIPAKYLTEVKKDALGPHMLEDLSLDGFDPQSEKTKDASVIVTRANFGCGSSREHAPWALEVNGITVVIAINYARIFRQNMFNCGMLAIELEEAKIDALFAMANDDVGCAVDIENKELTFTTSAKTETVPFSIAPFDEALVRAGGWVEYADKNL
ncbi:MAG: 3-isopropylmalate dehydratase small subunit [Deltaproteobacteria bacterium]|nr:3-isopropylmalate dehydratase small subunit [Deltaproteobacteria bacterium]